jgi:peptidoglycan/xylan/chitin deacetylase (PgdA/CDA1 family)
MTSSESSDELIRVRLVDPRCERIAWADGLEVMMPGAALAQAGLRRAVDSRGELRVPADCGRPADGIAGAMRLRAAFTPRPASSRLPFSYRSIPGPVRRVIAGVSGRLQKRRVHRWARFPMWPIDVSADVLADWAAPGPDGTGSGSAHEPTPVVLTHDIDSADGLRRLVSDFLPIEEELGTRSTSYVVPCAWPLDEGLLRESRARGHALGIHGYDHANRTPFAESAERRARLDAARPLAERFEMHGYRAPSLLRTPELLADLAARYRYDSSVPTSGGPFPVPNNGCASARPFRVGGLVEIPVSLPRDGSLRFLGHPPDEILDLWKQCALVVSRARGVVVLLTHCEPHFSGNPSMLRTYRRFLEWVAGQQRFAWATPLDAITRA